MCAGLLPKIVAGAMSGFEKDRRRAQSGEGISHTIDVESVVIPSNLFGYVGLQHFIHLRNQLHGGGTCRSDGSLGVG